MGNDYVEWDVRLLQSQTALQDNLNSWYTTYSNRIDDVAGLLGSSGKSEEEKNKVALEVLDKIKGSAKPFEVSEKSAENGITEADKFRKLGLTAIAEKLEEKATKILKEFAISMAGYKRINSSELKAFQQELSEVGDYTSKRRLEETPLNRYIGQNFDQGSQVADEEMAVPPADVLEKLEVAQKSKLFDAFSVLHIKYVPDPILCGRINESQDLYAIADWGEDVRICDIIKE